MRAFGENVRPGGTAMAQRRSVGVKVTASPLKLRLTLAERARAGFVSTLRKQIFDGLASSLRADYQRNVASRLAPRVDAESVRHAMRHRDSFKFYSSLRVTSQDLLYQVVRPAIERQRADFATAVRDLASDPRAPATLVLKEGFKVPRSVSALDIHLMPGSYVEEYGEDDPTMGAVYENRLALSTFGVFGPELDDIGQSIARFIALKYPKFRPRRILDLGCTAGHNTAAWRQVFGKAEVIGIDVAAPCLRYAAARAAARGLELRFEQMNAESLDYPDASFDLVISSMFLHEVPPRAIPRVLREAHRVLRPGGLMLHMELPPADQLSAYDSFYLDWDGHYNNEPYYRSFRAMNLSKLCESAGFSAADYVQHVVPSWTALGARRWREAACEADYAVDSGQTGRLASGVRWFCFGGWKSFASGKTR